MPIDQALIIQLEQQMDQAFAKNDNNTFRSLVHPDALMVIGGERTSGLRYSYAVSSVKVREMQLSDFQVIPLGEQAALIHYTMDVTGGEGMEDLTGRYLVTSAWELQDGDWKLVFNQDSRAEGFTAQGT